MDPARFPVEQVGAVAGDGLVGGQRIPGVVGKGDEVDGREAGEKPHVGTAAQRGHQSVDDAQAGGVSHVDHPPARVGGLPSKNQLAGIPPIEGDPRLLHQDFLQQPRALFGQKPGGLRRAGSGSGGDDVGGKGFRRIVGAASHHASLGPAGVGLPGVLFVSDHRHPPPGIAGQAQGRGGSGDAAADDQDIGGAGTGLGAFVGSRVILAGCSHRYWSSGAPIQQPGLLADRTGPALKSLVPKGIRGRVPLGAVSVSERRSACPARSQAMPPSSAEASQK